MQASPPPRALGLAVACLVVLGLVLGALRLLSPWPAGQPMGYGAFESQAAEGRFRSARFDGNIVRLETTTGEHVWVAVPDPGRAVGLLLESGAEVAALRPLPASGLSGPVLLAVLFPYVVLGGFLLMIVRAAARSQGVEAGTEGSAPGMGESGTPNLASEESRAQ